MKGSSVEQQLIDIDLLQLLLYGRSIVGAHYWLLFVRFASNCYELDCRLVFIGDELDRTASALLHENFWHIYFIVGVSKVGVLQCLSSWNTQFGLFLQHFSKEVDLWIDEGIPFWLSLSNSGPVSTISHSRFMAIISCAFLPINRCLLKMI